MPTLRRRSSTLSRRASNAAGYIDHLEAYNTILRKDVRRYSSLFRIFLIISILAGLYALSSLVFGSATRPDTPISRHVSPIYRYGKYDSITNRKQNKVTVPFKPTNANLNTTITLAQLGWIFEDPWEILNLQPRFHPAVDDVPVAEAETKLLKEYVNEVLLRPWEDQYLCDAKEGALSPHICRKAVRIIKYAEGCVTKNTTCRKRWREVLHFGSGNRKKQQEYREHQHQKSWNLTAYEDD